MFLFIIIILKVKFYFKLNTKTQGIKALISKC
ncbi:hypothetical protein [Chryseobacterium turcicum]